MSYTHDQIFNAAVSFAAAIISITDADYDEASVAKSAYDMLEALQKEGRERYRNKKKSEYVESVDE